MPAHLAHLAQRALAKDPSERPNAAVVLRSIEQSVGATAAEYLQHPWQQQSFEIRTSTTRNGAVRGPHGAARRDGGTAGKTRSAGTVTGAASTTHHRG